MGLLCSTSRVTWAWLMTEAADAVQEALVRLWRELRRGTTIEAPLAWT
jgi:DNA-directed RNA polymerase specialized sigma24 family protein